MGLLISRTNAPLRHLHDAQDCLRGLGFAVQFIGTMHQVFRHLGAGYQRILEAHLRCCIQPNDGRYPRNDGTNFPEWATGG